MKRLIFGIVILIVLLVGGFAAAIITLNTIDWSQYEEPIANAVKDATGRELHFSGALNVNIGLSPGISAAGITLQNADWASREQMLTLEQAEIQLKLLPLIFGQVELHQLKIIGFDLMLETNQQGKGNWEFDLADTPVDSEQVPADGDESMSMLSAVFLKKAIIQNATIIYKDGQTGASQRFSIEQLMAQMDSPTAPLFVDLAASQDEESFELAGEIDGIAGVLAGEPLGLDVTLNVAGATVMIKGAVARPLEADGIDIAVQVSGDSLSRLTELAAAPVTDLGQYQISVAIAGNADAIALSDLAVSLEAAGAQIGVSGNISDAIAVTGIDVAIEVKGDSLAALSTLADTELPDLGVFSVRANVAGTAEKINVNNLSIDIADMRIDGDLKADIGAEPVQLEMNLSSPKIDLTRLLPADDATGSGPVSDDSNSRMFPDDPLPLDSLDALDTIDAIVKLKTDELIVDSETTLTNLDIGLHAAKKSVSILPLKFSVMGATIDGRVGLEVAQEAAAVAAMLNIHHPSVGDLVEDDNKTMLVGGPFDMVIDVTGKGASVRDIMASLNGSLVTELGAAQASSQWMQRMFAEVTAILTKTVPKSGTTEPIELHCMVTDFRITEGVAEAESFVVDARNITLFGEGRVDLRDESLHLDFDWLAARSRTQDVLPPFKVRGTLVSPSSRFDTRAMLGKALGLGGESISASDFDRAGLAAESGPERCRQRLVVYRQIQEDRARPKEITVESVIKDIDTAKDALKKLGGFFKKKR